jgi:hypothetical protein
MLFGEKICQTQNIIWEFEPQVELQVLGSTQEEYNYRNKSVYTFNLFDSELDKFTFQIIGLDHVKIIQYINQVFNRDYRVLTGKFSLIDIFIKHNWKDEYQICLAINYENIKLKDHLVKFIFCIVQKLVKDLNTNIVCGYYFIHDSHIPLKEKEFHHFYGQSKLEESIPIQVSPRFKKNLNIWISPYSFSRINYQNSILIYQKIWDLCQIIEGKNKYILFGRDLYYPLKILDDIENADSIYGITHCPITYRDIIEDKNTNLSSNCDLVEKKNYCPTIEDYMTDTGYVLVLTAGRNGLGKTMCQLLLDHKDKIKQIVYIGCNTTNMKKDFTRLKELYTIREVYISNEFSYTDYNNNIAVLV